MKTLIKILLVLLAIPLTLLIIASIAVMILLSDDKVKTAVNDGLKETFSREAKLEGASISLWPPVSVNLSGLQVANRMDSGFTARPMIEVQTATAQLKLFSLLQGKVEISELSLSRPYILLETTADGRSNLDSLFRDTDATEVSITDTASTAEPDTSQPGVNVSTKENDFQVLFNRIAITEMTFEQLNRAENSSLTLTGLNAVLTGETRDGASLFATQGDIEIRNLSYENSFGKLADSLRITAKQKSTF
ncbi:MAG: AsmA family protein, partial [Rhizobacter sp.]|nr:AsmA family protein [Chlorobiales bacterium]